LKANIALQTALTLAFPTTYLLGATFPPQIVLFLYPRYSPPPPEKGSTRGKAFTNDIERELQNLLIVAQMRGMEGWYETSELVTVEKTFCLKAFI